MRTHNIAPTAQKFAAAALLLMMGACAPSVEQPQPAPTAPPPVKPIQPLPPAAQNWIDAPQTLGNWSYRAATSGSEAVFAATNGASLFALRCDRNARRIALIRHGGGTGPAVLRILTGTRSQLLEAQPRTDGTLATQLDPRDPLLDAMIFTRGRFAVEAGALPTLYLPSWPEIARVVEDCR